MNYWHFKWRINLNKIFSLKLEWYWWAVLCRQVVPVSKKKVVPPWNCSQRGLWIILCNRVIISGKKYWICMFVMSLSWCYWTDRPLLMSGCDYKELISPPRWDSPRSERALSLWKNHTWWELRNNAASGMFPRWPVGSDGGPAGWLSAS